MKHLRLKSLTLGALLVGTLFAGNVHAQRDAHGLEAKTLCTLKNGGRYLALTGFGDKAGWGHFGSPNGGNGRIYLERVADDKVIIGGQGLFITGIADGSVPTVGPKEEAIEFTVNGTTATGLSFEHDGIYLARPNDVKGSATEKTWEFNVFGANGYKAQLDDGQNINVGTDRYSVLMFPFAVSAPDGKYVYRYEAGYEGVPEGSYVFVGTTTLPAGEPGLYKSTSDDGERRLNIDFTDDDKTAIAEYVDQPKTVGGIMTGFYSYPGINSNGADFLLGVKDGNVGFYKDLVNEGNANNVSKGAYKQDQTNIAYIKADADVPYYTLTYDEERNIIIMKRAPRTDAIINECVALVAQLKAMKENVGTEEGQYDVTRPKLGADWAVWTSLDSYDEPTDDYYVENNNEETLTAWKTRLEAIVEKVKACFVERALGLAEVNIFTLQWNGTGRYSGINGGGKWENPSDFGTPNGGNGRIAVVHKEENRYYISSQGLFLKITPEGQRVTAENRDDATAFVTTRSSENGLTFMTEDGWYLTGAQFTPSQREPEQDYKINTFGNYANISVADGATELDGVYYSSIVMPYKVRKPDNAAYHTFVFTRSADGIVAEDVDVVPAGVPFLYVGPSKGDESRMPIPQEDQEYVETISAEHVLDGFLARIEGDEKDALVPTIYTLSVRDGKIGYFLGGGFTENTPANRGYISQATATELDGSRFELVYSSETGTLDVVISNPLAAAIGEAIAKFIELNEVVTAATVTDKDRYEYVFTDEDNALLDGGYDEAAAYEGKTLEEVVALKEMFQALIDAIKATRTTGLKDVNIVTLQWNGAGRYTGLNGRTSWTSPGDFGEPNGPNGRIGILKKDDGYVIASQGVFYKILEDGTKGDAQDENDATRFIVTGSVEDGLTFEAGGKYLTGSQLDITEEKPAQSYKVNTFGTEAMRYAKAYVDLVEVGDVYMAAVAIPYKVMKPEGEGYHTYIVNKVGDTVEAEEVDTVGAGVPFIYVSPTNDNDAKRLLIPQDDQAYAAVPTEGTLLTGMYLESTVGDAYVFGTETDVRIEGEGDDAQYVTVTVGGFFLSEAWKGGTNVAYISADTAADFKAAKFVFADGKLQIFDADGNDVLGISEANTGISVNNGAIYSLSGVRVSTPVKGRIYIVNGKKLVVK